MLAGSALRYRGWDPYHRCKRFVRDFSAIVISPVSRRAWAQHCIRVRPVGLKTIVQAISTHAHCGRNRELGSTPFILTCKVMATNPASLEGVNYLSKIELYNLVHLPTRCSTQAAERSGAHPYNEEQPDPSVLFSKQHTVYLLVPRVTRTHTETVARAAPSHSPRAPAGTAYKRSRDADDEPATRGARKRVPQQEWLLAGATWVLLW